MNAIQRLESMTQDQIDSLTTKERENLYNAAQDLMPDEEAFFTSDYN
jgi:hypothetical protein